MTKFPRLTPVERLQVTLLNTLPGFARGVVIANPRTTALLARLGVERQLVALFDRLRERYRGSPVWAGSAAGRPTLLVLSPSHTERVLGGSDQLYSPDTGDKHRMLAVFEPNAVIVSRGRLRTLRRGFNETILDSNAHRPSHADHLMAVVTEEIGAMMDGPGSDGVLNWAELKRGFDRVGRRVVFGDAARDDAELTAMLARLRRYGNARGAAPGARRRIRALRLDWDNRVARYAESAPGTSLIGRVTDTYTPTLLRPLGQLPHWLMEFDRVGAFAARTLALLASHPRQFARVNEELAAADDHHGRDTAASVAAQPYLEACFLESTRLWPPVADLVRATTRPVDWDGVILPAGTALLISTLHQHRSRFQGPKAHRFVPELWLDGAFDADWSVLPFGLGPGRCPGGPLAVFLGTAVCAAVLRRAYVRLAHPPLATDKPLPLALPAASLRFSVGAKPRVAVPVAQASGAAPLDT